MTSLSKIQPWFRKHDGWWYLTRTVAGKREQTKLALGRENEETAYRRFYELMAAAGEIEPSPEISFNELAAKFLEFSAKHNAPGTTNGYLYLIDSFDQFYNGRIADLKHTHVHAWLETKEWGVSSRRAAITAVKRVVNWGLEEGYVGAYPIGLRKLRRPRVKRRETTVENQDHQRMMEASDEAFRRVLTALFETGARPGEIRMVTSQMVNLEVGIWVLAEHKSAHVTDKPRVVYLTEQMIQLTKELMREHPQGPLFRNSKGQPWTANAIRCRMRRLREKLNLPAGTVAYAYRHTYATNGLEQGVTIAEMTELLGHSDSKMLSEHYGHLSQKTQHLRTVAGKAVE